MAGSRVTRRRVHTHDGGQVEDHLAADVPAPAAPMGLMTVGAADHPAEAAADAAADRALSSLDRVRRSAVPTTGCGHDHTDGLVHRHTDTTSAAEVGLDGGSLQSDTDAAIRGLQGRGRPLPTPVRREMEQAFGTPLDRVRVHTGSAAADLNARVSARAFTVGQDIFFGGDQLTSARPQDRHTVAHEIAHTLQGGTGIGREYSPVIRRDPDGTGEVEVERLSSNDIVNGLQDSGNYGIGSATRTQTEKAAIAWLGPGQKLSPKSGIWWSADRSKSYRPPSEKKTNTKFVKAGTWQANFQTHDETGAVLSNGHVTIVSAT